MRRRVRTVLGNRSSAAAFLCYHSVSDEGPRFLSMPAELFERQLRLLQRLGWESGTSDRLRALLDGGRADRPLAFLTFDDGFADNETTVLPLVRAYDFTPMVFVLPPFVDRAGPFAWPEMAKHHGAHHHVLRSMDWAAVERLAEAGAEIGSHTLTHRQLPELSPEALREELVDSRRALLERFGRCDAVAYPFGTSNAAIAAAAADAGYSFAFTLPKNGQRPLGPHAIPRIVVDRRDDERRFRAKLSPAGRRFLLSPLMPLARRVTTTRSATLGRPRRT